jgi:hypothetical protein
MKPILFNTLGPRSAVGTIRHFRSSILNLKLPLLLAFCLLPSALCLAESPLGTAFQYQGRLGVGTNAANGIYDFRFAIYDVASGGTAVSGPVTNSLTGVTNGLFTVALDFGAAVFNGDARWLAIEVRTNGGGAFTLLTPRQPLPPTPYALYAPSAGNAERLNGQLATAFAPASGSTAYVAKAGDTMTGTLNLPANGLVAGANQLILSGGNVGIGTAPPQAKLDVAGTVKADLFAGSGAGLIGISGSALADATVSNAKLANSSITLAAGSGLSGGGIAPLGGSVTLNNSGVLSVTGNSDITASPTTGNVTLGTTATSVNTANTIVKRNSSGNFSAGTITLNGALSLPSTTASAGIIFSAGTPLLHAYGSQNVFAGADAGNLAMSGDNNVGMGYQALHANTTGTRSTANGVYALVNNTIGSFNTAIGFGALYYNTTGSNNVASGNGALWCNTNGYGNTAFGVQSLYNNTQGNDNTANGYHALYSNTTGGGNTANGAYALQSNTNFGNTASGYRALSANTYGYMNTADGNGALQRNTIGYENTACGTLALGGNSSGVGNIAIGYNAGANLTTGHYNIDIGNSGNAGESWTMRIGTQGTQTRTFIAGIYGATAASGAAVYVNSSGQLGTVTSSRRFKEAIADMGDQSEVLLSLRPVSFHYKPEIAPQGTTHFGLVAEEVEQVAPELVLYDGNGEIYSVRYDQISAMLLNEFLKEHRKVQEQQRELDQVRAVTAQLKVRFEKLERLLNQ